MRSQNAAYLAAAGFGSTGFNNTGSGAMLPNLGRTSRLSFPKTDYTAIGKTTMSRGDGDKLRPGVLTYLTNSDYDYVLSKTSKKHRGRDVSLVTKDYAEEAAQMTTAQGMSHGKAFVAVIRSEADGGGDEIVSEEAEEETAEEAGEPKPEPTASLALSSGAAASAIAAEVRAEAPMVGGGGSAAALGVYGGGAPPAPGQPLNETESESETEGEETPEQTPEEKAEEAEAGGQVVKTPGEVTREQFLSSGRNSAATKAGMLNTLLKEPAFASSKNDYSPISSDKGELIELRAKLVQIAGDEALKAIAERPRSSESRGSSRSRRNLGKIVNLTRKALSKVKAAIGK